jgi:hypothetical protein
MGPIVMSAVIAPSAAVVDTVTLANPLIAAGFIIAAPIAPAPVAPPFTRGSDTETFTLKYGNPINTLAAIVPWALKPAAISARITVSNACPQIFGPVSTSASSATENLSPTPIGTMKGRGISRLKSVNDWPHACDKWIDLAEGVYNRSCGGRLLHGRHLFLAFSIQHSSLEIGTVERRWFSCDLNKASFVANGICIVFRGSLVVNKVGLVRLG